MSKLDTNYIINLDLIKDRVNSVMNFCLVDVETSDFYLVLYNNGTRIFDKNYTVTLYIVKPNGNFKTIELEPKENLKKYYCNLPDTLKNIHGEYLCQAVIFDNSTGEKKISKSKFKYSVDLDLASEMAGIIDEEEQESILTNILNRLLTLENPVEPYATQKHVDECVSTLTEEIDTIKEKDTEQDGKLSNIESKNTEQDNRLNTIESKDIEQDERLANIESKNTEQDNRLTDVETKDTEQDNRLTSIETKDVEQDGRLNLLENKVDGIDEKIVDTIEPSLDNYGNRLDALETKDIEHEQRMTNIETKNTEQDNRLNSLESKDLVHESRLTNIESKNIEQDERLSNIETKDTEEDNRLDIAENRLANIGDDITNTMQPIIDEHTSRLNDIEAIDVAQNNRLDAIEAKNSQQDDRLSDIEKVNSRQDIDIKCLYGASQTIDVTKEGNSIYLQNSNNGFAVVDEIKGNTLVNCNKEPDKELILNGNINTSRYNAVTLTEGVDGGLVDVALEGNTLVNVSKTKDITPITKEGEDTTGNHIALADEGSIRPVLNGNTMVNVCDQRDPVAITKSYTVKTGNHVALQGEYDGKCRPVVTGNTLVNLWQWDKLTKSESNINIDDSGYISIPTQNSYVSTIYSDLNIKIGSTYTYIIEVSEFSLLDSNGTTQNELLQFIFPYGWANMLSIKSTGYYTGTFTANEIKTTNNFRFLRYGGTTGNFKARITILEGDYTNKPTPEYFEGLQSSFEDKVVTQEMVDNGEELAENLGKYKVDYVVTGKNKFDKSKALDGYKIQNIKTGAIGENSEWFVTDYIPVIPNTKYKISGKANGAVGLIYDSNKNLIPTGIPGGCANGTITIPSNARYIKLNGLLTQKDTFQLEEGDTATPYEPYKEYKKTFYLNSPLLEGDTIEQQGNNVVHVHRYGKVVLDGSNDEEYIVNNAEWGSGYTRFLVIVPNAVKGIFLSNNIICDRYPNITQTDSKGIPCIHTSDDNISIVDSVNTLDEFRAKLQSNPTTVVYKLQTLTYEVISQNDTILCDSYTSGHLDVDSAVPIEKVDFLHFKEDLTYLYANTQYTVQFVSDAVSKVDITLGGAKLLNQDVVVGTNKYMITTPSELIDNNLVLNGEGFNASNIVVTPAIEQDFDYFSGIQSCFEDNLVTEGENAGKYKVDYMVTGKNKFKLKDTPFSEINETGLQISLDNGGVVLNGSVANGWNSVRIGSIKTSEKNKTYTLKYNQNKASATWHGFVGDAYLNGELVKEMTIYYLGKRNDTGDLEFTITTPNDTDFDEIVLRYYISWDSNLPHTYDNFILSNIQIEEGDIATSYEPYKEYTKTLYLNSPLLEGDTIEEKDGNIYHVHRYNSKVYETGDENTYITDLINTVCPLETPQYELIQQGTIAMPTYANGHLDVTTAVPLDKVNFLHFEEELTYLYPSTSYTVQFVSDNATTVDITLGGAKLLAQSIVAGLNRISITTPATLVDNKLVIDGAGANISKVVVTDTNREFVYFEGMKSVGEGGNLVITSSNSDNSISNTQTLTHAPLRGVGDVKDRYVLIDGKWYIKRNCIEANLSDFNKSWQVDPVGVDFKRYYIDNFAQAFIVDNLPRITDEQWSAYNTPGVYLNNKNKAIGIIMPKNLSISEYVGNSRIIYRPKVYTPTYEPIDYNPLEVYSGTTHISTNSTIPTNITVKNHGFNCLLKPSTTYTISSNLGLNTVTTPSVLTEDCLRFMDTDTSDVTTMKDVLVLEGDWTTKADLIPANFSGMESAFEQEYDAEKGKYKINVKVANEDKTQENNITFYINEPLRGIGDVKDRIHVKDDKVVVERNCGIRPYEDGDFGTYPTDKVNTVYQLAEPVYEEVEYNDTKLFIESFKNSTLFYNSNVPVTSKLYYSYSVPIVDTVAQTADISDQQDSMIIDMATQCAVMEMMLM